MFKGIFIQKDNAGYHAEVADIDESHLPEGDVIVHVNYSSLNYKDGLAITGKSPVVRQFPMIPGIDLAGTVLVSKNVNYRSGDKVIVNGWGLGEKYWGGLAQKASLKSEWLTRLPENITLKQSMIIGTAGYTAMLAVMALQKHGITPHCGKILVTGANGGVGSFAIAILSRLGYQVVASTGRMEESDYLLNTLGAKELIDRNELSGVGKPLMKERWIGAIDSVGSNTLANICASTIYGGTVAACGLAQGMDFNSTVAPFILRGVTLAGIDSVMCSYENRLSAWRQLSQIIDPVLLERIGVEIPLTEVVPMAVKLMDGKVRGRVVVNLTE